MRRTRLSYANVISTLALFLAVAGGTTAVALNGKNNVDANDIQQGAVAGREVKNDTLFARDLGKGSVGTSELQSASVTGGKITDATVCRTRPRHRFGRQPTNSRRARSPEPRLPTARSERRTSTRSSLFNDNSLTGLDIAEGTLFNDNSLNRRRISTRRASRSSWETEPHPLTGGEVPDGDSVVTSIPSGHAVIRLRWHSGRHLYELQRVADPGCSTSSGDSSSKTTGSPGTAR